MLLKAIKVAGCWLLFACTNVTSPHLQVQLITAVDHPNEGALVLDGLPVDAAALSQTQWRKVFAVWLGPRVPGDDLPAMAGRYVAEGGRVVFRPIFPFKSGRPHVARVDIEQLYRLLDQSPPAPAIMRIFPFQPPARSTPPPQVIAVYPQAPVVPANLLKFYVQFSQPMRAGHVMDHLRLETSDGRSIDGAFLAMDQELWSADRTRLTLFFHPGRIKRGLGGHERNGLALKPNEAVRLVIAETVANAAGVPMGKAKVMQYQVGAVDRRSPQPDAWTVRAPLVHSREPLTLAFDEPLDQALLARFIGVRRIDGPQVRGKVVVDADQMRWQLIPERPWRSGAYRIDVDVRLEDLAGNRLNGLFDVDLHNVTERQMGVDGPVHFTFQIKP